MKLSDLEKIIERAKGMGFKPEEIEVEFKDGYTTMKVTDSKICVSATLAGAKPVLTITLSKPSTNSYI